MRWAWQRWLFGIVMTRELGWARPWALALALGRRPKEKRRFVMFKEIIGFAIGFGLLVLLILLTGSAAVLVVRFGFWMLERL